METSEFHEHITHDCVWHITLNVENSGGYVAKICMLQKVGLCRKRHDYVRKIVVL